MEDLNYHLAASISSNLSRKEIFVWSLCNRFCHNLLVYELCRFRLTEQQSKVVQKLLELKADDWLRLLVGGREIAQKFTISSGPSTGKTAIVLYTVAHLQRIGRPSFIIAPLKLVRQWRSEAIKFAEHFRLPPFCIVHPRYNANWRQLLASGHIPIVPQSLFQSYHRSADKPMYHTMEEFLAFTSWKIAFSDESSLLPYRLRDYAVQHRDFFMVALDASQGVAGAISNYLKDTGLGKLPEVETLVQLSSTVYQIKPPLDEAIEFIQKHRGRKTLLLCHSSKLIKTSEFQNNRYAPPKSVNYLTRPAYRKAMAELGFVNICVMNKPEDKTAALEAFAAADTGALAAPYHYVKRGFNLRVEAVIVLTSDNPQPRSLLQLLGRVRRIESPFPNVRLCILQNHRFSGAELAFHAFAASGIYPHTDELIKAAEAFERRSPRYFVNPTNRKRFKIDQAILDDHSIAGKLALLKIIYSRSAEHVVEATEARILVRTNLQREPTMI